MLSCSKDVKQKNSQTLLAGWVGDINWHSTLKNCLANSIKLHIHIPAISLKTISPNENMYLPKACI